MLILTPKLKSENIQPIVQTQYTNLYSSWHHTKSNSTDNHMINGIPHSNTWNGTEIMMELQNGAHTDGLEPPAVYLNNKNSSD